ncbi:30S ribosomal protein S16 [Criblamydia sequanensis]|uniref:Small ribosomal subunit protein bS16 n=1 Tax=Candidatus Criblamydia sequanensis CRIB-18 TaxID=1437425 RepID=A0A090D302_9BACT|nr:30S ribosomal protein S16 [Criblamydia sequanensis]CDR35100.1 30S ribosomal protein S16 [Criblamydia sequanensis CRIB-18]
MGLKIRLRKQGRTNRETYRLVVTDTRTKRDGKYVEALGWYDPLASKEEMTLSLKADRVAHWLEHGAELSERAQSLVFKVAPEIIRTHTERTLAHKAKMAAKRKARNKASKQAA